MIKKALFFQYLICLICFAQNEGNIWYFGQNAGIDFNMSPPQALSDSKMDQHEGCATICEMNGKLMFYTDGMTVWSYDHSIMENGTDLLGNSSSSNSAIAIPKSMERKLYYLFTVEALSNPSRYLSYSIVDMNENGGLGIVTDQKNIVICDSTYEKVTAVKKRSDKGFWLITVKVEGEIIYESSNPDKIYYLVYSVDSAAVSASPVHIFASPSNSFPKWICGTIKVSPDGSKIAAGIGPYVEILDFDNENGIISNSKQVIVSNNSSNVKSHIYGVEFSLNSQFLYTSEVSGFIGLGLCQFDVSLPTSEAILNSKVTITKSSELFGVIQIAPDGKIYLAMSGAPYLSVIEKPNQKGTDCEFVENGFQLSPNTFSKWGLPNFVQSFFNLQLEIVANPGDSTFFSQDTSIELSVFYNGSKIDDATVYYTLDKTAPDSINGTEYQGPITITKTTTLKAIAYKKDYIPAEGTWRYYKKVNKPPVVTVKYPKEVLEDCDEKSIHLTDISDGDTGIVQDISISAKSKNKSIIRDLRIDYIKNSTEGYIYFKPEPDAFGKAVITITVNDNGGTQGNGIDYVVKEITIHVLPVNDMPTFEMLYDSLSITLNDIDVKMDTLCVKNILAGPMNEQDQKMHFTLRTNHKSAFSKLPSLNAQNGHMEFTLSNNLIPRITVYITLHDNGGTDNGGFDKSEEKPFHIFFDMPPEPTFKVIGPVNPHTWKIPKPLLSSNSGIKKGTVIEIDFQQNLEEVLLQHIQCKATFYDALGNYLGSCKRNDSRAQKVHMDFIDHKKSTRLMVYWSGGNTNNRYTGFGTHLAVISLVDYIGREYHETRIISFKK